MTIVRRTLLGALASGALLAMLACAGDGEAPPAVDVPPDPGAVPGNNAAVTPTPVATGEIVATLDPPDVERILQHIRFLAGDIGPRVAGEPEERRAADYIAAELGEAGYETAIEPFTFIDAYDESHILLPADRRIDGYMLDGSALGNAFAFTSFGGTGQAHELDLLPVQNRVLILDRGAIPFAEKVQHAEEAGAIAVVIINNQPGPYQGTLGNLRSSIPVIGVAREVRDDLLDIAGRTTLTVITHGGHKERSSQNVVGREGECVAYIGAHYDSVPGSPGANDNASGVAMVLELARAYRADGLCVVAFGAEEVGLWGSRAFVEAPSVSGVRFMLNFDMVGKVTRPIIVGDERLTDRILAILNDVPDSPLRAGAFPPFASSDHVSFTAVGVPAVTIHSGDDEHIHSPEDDLDNVDARSLGLMLRSAEATLSGLLAQQGLIAH